MQSGANTPSYDTVMEITVRWPNGSGTTGRFHCPPTKFSCNTDSVFFPNGLVWHQSAITKYKCIKSYSRVRRLLARNGYTHAERDIIVRILKEEFGAKFS
jgi:hypothetical protein